MDDKIGTINFDEIDFLAITEDDFTLSQICDAIEKEEELIDGMNHFDINPTGANALDLDLFGDFNLDGMDGGATDRFSETNSDESTKRFGGISDYEIEKLISSQENQNTNRNTRWAFGVFEKWRQEKSKNLPFELAVPELLHMDVSTMSYSLTHFVCDARKKDGSEYPPKSVYYLVCGLLRYLRDNKRHDINFFSDLKFAEFRKTLDAQMKSLLSKGLGTKVKQADPITQEDEELLWEREVLGNKSAETLQYTVFFYMCKLFGLRGFDEHRDLTCANVTIGEDGRGKYIHFCGGSNKTFKGGLAHLSLQSKDIRHYCQPGDRCIADYFHQYLDALGNEGEFYRRPLAGNPIRYGAQVVGVNKIKTFMKIICKKGGLVGNFTNHSGKRTCASQLYSTGMDEQAIMERTGHRSERAVRKYKRSCPEVAENVSKILDPPAPKAMKMETPYDENDNQEPMCAENTLEKVCESLQSMASSSNSSKQIDNRAMADLTNKFQFENCKISFNF
ncbi:zinc finger MYM-type protein 3-like [Saccostrea cucullata]|uniref:zinc finger MYM-type protein 3-like n=1 Tax=Saccostrea cuccullata TaxID=36930 RepID=UPI002ED2DBAA